MPLADQSSRSRTCQPWSVIAASISSTASFTVRAPSDAPVTSSVLSVGSIPSRLLASSRGGGVRMSARIGQPVTWIFDLELVPTSLAVASNWQQTARTTFIRNWFALPGTTSGLSTAVGMPRSAAFFTATPAA